MGMLRKAENALMLMLCMAEKPRTFQSLMDIAGKQQLPAGGMKYTVMELEQAGLIESKRGHAGGYRLAKAPWSITLYDVLAAVETPIPENILLILKEPPATAIGRAICEAIRKDGVYELRRLTLEKLAERISISTGMQREPSRLPRDRLALAK